MSERPTITAMREWLKGCPLIAEEQTENGAAFRVSGLSPEPVVESSIEDSPTDPVTAVFFSGRNMAKSYLFVSRREYSEAQSVQIANSGFFEQLADWVLAQNDRHILPRLEGSKTPLRVSVTSSGYIVTSGAGSCKMQLSVQRTLSIQGDRCPGDAFQDFILSHKIAFGSGQTVVVPYIFFSLRTGKGEKGEGVLILTSDVGGSAGANATFAADFKGIGTPEEFDYITAAAG